MPDPYDIPGSPESLKSMVVDVLTVIVGNLRHLRARSVMLGMFDTDSPPSAILTNETPAGNKDG